MLMRKVFACIDKRIFRKFSHRGEGPPPEQGGTSLRPGGWDPTNYLTIAKFYFLENRGGSDPHPTSGFALDLDCESLVALHINMFI